jgi:hypothetical protein
VTRIKMNSRTVLYLVKFLDPDKPVWQQALALELLHRLTVQPALLREFCRCYDCRPHATNIFQVRNMNTGTGTVIYRNMLPVQ